MNLEPWKTPEVPQGFLGRRGEEEYTKMEKEGEVKTDLIVMYV